jgi:hypothetical protein
MKTLPLDFGLRLCIIEVGDSPIKGDDKNADLWRSTKTE